MLPAALHFRRGPVAVRAPAAVQHRRLGGVARRGPAHRRTTAAGVARGRDPAAGRQRFLPRRDHELVREPGRGLRVRTGEKRAFRAPDQETDEAGAAAFRQEGQGGPGVRGFPLPHANQLGAGAQGGGQGGVSGEGRKPAFRGDVADAQASGGATLIRDDLLRPRRDGEPHQGAAAGAVRRPHLDRAIAVESDPLIFFIDRVLFAGDAAAAGVGGDEDGAGAMHDDPAAVVEDRSAHPDHGAQSVDFAGDGIRLGGGVRPSV